MSVLISAPIKLVKLNAMIFDATLRAVSQRNKFTSGNIGKPQSICDPIYQ